MAACRSEVCSSVARLTTFPSVAGSGQKPRLHKASCAILAGLWISCPGQHLPSAAGYELGLRPNWQRKPLSGTQSSWKDLLWPCLACNVIRCHRLREADGYKCHSRLCHFACDEKRSGVGRGLRQILLLDLRLRSSDDRCS